MTKLIGIDVSEHNGVIDWQQVKQDGIQFAMIRMGYGSDIQSQDDERFHYNVEMCERFGIPWGTYLYSYALNNEQAISEAEHALRLLEGKTPQFPVAFDMEDGDGYKRRHGMPSGSELVDICYTFLDIVEKSGYYVSLYANKSWLNGRLKSKRLDRFDKWVAQWNDECTYNGFYLMWQYTSEGEVNGIRGNVDMNEAYSDFNFNVPDETYVNYLIKSGDTLWDIAQKYNSTINEIVKLNPDTIKNPDLIYPGDYIKIPKR